MNDDIFQCHNFVYSPDFISDPKWKPFMSWNKESLAYTTFLLRGSYMHRLSSSTIACHFLNGTTFATTFIINSTCMSSEWSRHNCYCLWSWAEWKLYLLFIYRRSLYPEIRVIHIFHICENKYANHFVLHFKCIKVHSWVVDTLSSYVEIPKLEISPEIKYPDWCLSWFFLVPPYKCWDSTVDSLLRIILPFKALWSVQWNMYHNVKTPIHHLNKLFPLALPQGFLHRTPSFFLTLAITITVLRVHLIELTNFVYDCDKCSWQLVLTMCMCRPGFELMNY